VAAARLRDCRLTRLAHYRGGAVPTRRPVLACGVLREHTAHPWKTRGETPVGVVTLAIGEHDRVWWHTIASGGKRRQSPSSGSMNPTSRSPAGFGVSPMSSSLRISVRNRKLRLVCIRARPTNEPRSSGTETMTVSPDTEMIVASILS
jgi:hypothetical protein